MCALIVNVKGVDNRAEVVVDVEVVDLPDVLGDVDGVRLVSNFVKKPLNGRCVITHSREVEHEFFVNTLGLALKVAKVEVASPTQQHHLVGMARFDNLVARCLRANVAFGTQRKTSTVGLVEVLKELVEVGKTTRQRTRQTVSVGLLYVLKTLVVKSPNMVDVGARNHLEMDLGVLEHKLVGVVRVQLAGERAVGEDGIHPIDLEQALIEKVSDGALADPVVVIGINGAIRRQAPIVTVEVGADHGAREILGGDNRAVKRGDGPRRDFHSLGEAEALELVRALSEDGTDSVSHSLAEIRRLRLVDRVGRDDHKAGTKLEDTAVLAEEVGLDISEDLGRERGDVGGEERHSNQCLKTWKCLGIYSSRSIFH